MHKSESKHVSKTKQETKVIKNKSIDKKANYFVYLWLLLIPIGMYIYRELKNKLFIFDYYFFIQNIFILYSHQNRNFD